MKCLFALVLLLTLPQLYGAGDAGGMSAQPPSAFITAQAAAVANPVIADTSPAFDALAQGFRAPPAECHPASYAFIYVNNGGGIPEVCVQKDMLALKAAGVTTVLVYFPGGVDHNGGGNRKLVFGATENRLDPTEEYSGPGVIREPIPPSPAYWSPEWRKTLRLVAREGTRLGLEVGISMDQGGGEIRTLPIPDEYHQQILTASKIVVQGPKQVRQTLPLDKEVVLKKDGSPRYYRDLAVLAIPADGPVAPSQVLDISGHMADNGELNWMAPGGKWEIVRFGYSMRLSGGWGGAFIDHLNPKALDAKWAITVGLLLKEMTPEERRSFTFVESDSYEGGAQTWTAAFRGEFRKRRGYDILPWLPVLAGRIVGDKDRSARFQRDYQLTISDLYADSYYSRFAELARSAGLKFYAEAAGPHQGQADKLKSLGRCDVSMGEFWVPGTHRGVDEWNRFLLRDAAAAAHGYGIREVFCEAFTGGPDPWMVYPFRMKPVGDQAFCDGLTRPCLHGYNMTLWPDAKPNIAYWAGTHLSRTVTWWDQAGAFMLYQARCSHLLRQGLFVADVAYYDGHGIGKSLGRKADFPALGPGYDYDRINTEILLTRMTVKDGRLVLPDGMSYRVLVLEKNIPLPVEVLRKLLALVEAGGTVIGMPPPAPYGLMDDPAEFSALIGKLWGAGTLPVTGARKVGAGRVVWGKGPLQWLAEDGVPPDVEFGGVSSKGAMDWIHRRTDEADIYFLSSRWEPVEQVDCAFRVSGRVPELWDPVTGRICEAGAFRQESGRTVLPLRFDPCGSAFVVFRKPTAEKRRNGRNWDEFKPLQTVAGPWQVDYETAWFYPRPEGMTNSTVLFEALMDWSTHPLDAVKYYSGKATYRTGFEWKGGQVQDSDGRASGSTSRLWMDLGEVREVASVRLNGVDLGVLWTKPFRVDVTGVLKPGANTLEIDVVNLWPNRLIGDTFLPEDKRRTRTNITKFTQYSRCLPSGLLGPVTIQQAVHREVVPAPVSGKAVPPEVLEKVYQEVRTPYKYGVILKAEEPGAYVDAPQIFRYAGKWYMMYIQHDKDQSLGFPYVMYYNARSNRQSYERIGMALSRDMREWTRYGKDPVIDHGRGIAGGVFGCAIK